MNIAQFERLRGAQSGSSPNAAIDLMAHLHNHTDRTLLYGYTLERKTFHVFIQEGHLFRAVYDGPGAPEEDWEVSVGPIERDRVVPDKRLYPAACDSEACWVLTGLQIDLPFTAYQDRPEQTYHGRILSPEALAALISAQPSPTLGL